MNKEYIQALARQLEEHGEVIFIHNAQYFYVFKNSSNEYEYDIRDGFENEIEDGGINTDYTALQTIQCLIEEN